MDVRNLVFLGANASFSHSSLALRYLAGGVDRSRWRPVLVECTTQDDIGAVLARIALHTPHALAATFYLFNRAFLKKVTRRVKHRFPTCLLIGGGPEFLGDNRAVLKDMPWLDLAVRGEGERPFAAILDRFDDPATRARIPGVCGLHNGRYIDNGRAEQVSDLTQLPLPYDRFPPPPGKPFVQLETSRGCANRCSFCTSAGTSPVRTLPIDRTRRELAALREAGVRQIRLVDRTFNAAPRRAVELLRMFREEFPGLGFHLEVDPARLTPAVTDALAAAPAGQLHIEAGVQSLDPDATRGTRRGGTPQKTLRGLSRLCAMPHLQVHADLIAGLPGTTLQTVLRDLDTLTRIGPAEIQLEVLKVLPGTPLADEADRLGLRWSRRPPYAIHGTPDMPPHQIRKARRLSVLVDRFYNADCLQPVVIHASTMMDGFWRKLLARFPSMASLAALRVLSQRFVILDNLLAGTCQSARNTLHYAWMRKGLSARHGICRAIPVKHGIPSNARLIEGRADIPVARAYQLTAGKSFIFAYASGREHGRVGAVYELV